MDLMQLLDMILHVDKALGQIITQYGTLVYAVLFAIIFAESGVVVLFFLPGDTLLFVGGALCATGALNVWLLIILLVVAAVTGYNTNYWIGETIGHRMFTHNYRWLNKDGLHKAHVFFEKHGGKTIVMARFIPVVRTFAPFVAGVSDMTFKKFQLFNMSGAMIWVGGLVFGGYFFGNIPIIRDHLNTIVLGGVMVGVGAGVIPFVLNTLHRLTKKGRAK